MKVHKAVIPAAGFGTRFLPGTKAVPKEMILLVDQPVIQYVVEEAVASGMDEICIIISAGKEDIINHFSPAPILEERLEKTGKKDLLAQVRSLTDMAKFTFLYQKELKGLGDAILCAKEFVKDDPFAILLGDTVVKSSISLPVTGQLAQVYEKTGKSVIASEEVARENLHKYGIIGSTPAPETGEGEWVQKIFTMKEKPAPEEAPGHLAVASRYLFTPTIFEELAKTPPGKGGEIQLTDAVVSLLKREDVYTRKIQGRRYDLGSKQGFLQATVEFGLDREEFREKFAAFLQEQVKNLP